MNPKTAEVLQALHWRYATKVFDPAKKIPPETWVALEQALVLTPTSYGMQPYQFLIVQDPAKRAELLPQSWNQKQVVDCSHYVVFLGRTEVNDDDVDRLIQRTSVVRGLPTGKLDFYRNMIRSDLVNGPRGKAADQWAARQCYIALGNLMTVAALLGVDACPMEGLVPEEYDRILGLTGSGYQTVMALALGYRAADDKYAALAKVRYDTKDLIRVV